VTCTVFCCLSQINILVRNQENGRSWQLITKIIELNMEWKWILTCMQCNLIGIFVRKKENECSWHRLNHIHLILRKQRVELSRTPECSAFGVVCTWWENKNASYGSQKTKKKTPKNMPAPTVLIWATTWTAIGFLTGQNSCFTCPRLFSLLS